MLDNIKDKTFLLMCTVRYCLGRQTYAIREINTLLKRYWEDIPRNDRKTILEDIKKYQNGYITSFNKKLWDEILDLGLRDKLIVEK